MCRTGVWETPGFDSEYWQASLANPSVIFDPIGFLR
eukprot:COSAG06_NODE_49444_length_325_cov_0.911504_1_plen_35_part_10